MFEQFQAQQKRAKDEERKKKTEAAAALQGYRKTDLSEEEMKLAALREADRLQKAEAAAALQQYRKAGLSEDEARAAAAKQEELRKKQLLEEQLRTGGVVTSHDPSIHSSLAQMKDSGAVSAMAATFGIAAAPAAPGGTPASNGDNGEPNSLTPPAVVPPPPPAPPLPEVTDEPTTAATTTDTTTTTTAAEMTVPQPPAAVPAPEVTTIIQSSINFVFGLITVTSDEPIVTDGYLERTNQITNNVLLGLQQQQQQPSASYPQVKSVTKDEANSNADSSRYLVTVSIPFTAPNDAMATDFNAAVVSEIRNAIASGTFTKD